MMRGYTTVEQSKKLAEILPTESADMTWKMVYGKRFTFPYYEEITLTPYKLFSGSGIPCWSLSALLEQLDDEITDEDGNDYNLTIVKESLQYQLYYHDSWGQVEDIETDYYDDLIDACYEMIVKLKEEGLI